MSSNSLSAPRRPQTQIPTPSHAAAVYRWRAARSASPAYGTGGPGPVTKNATPSVVARTTGPLHKLTSSRSVRQCPGLGSPAQTFTRGRGAPAGGLLAAPSATPRGQTKRSPTRHPPVLVLPSHHLHPIRSGGRTRSRAPATTHLSVARPPTARGAFPEWARSRTSLAAAPDTNQSAKAMVVQEPCAPSTDVPCPGPALAPFFRGP